MPDDIRTIVSTKRWFPVAVVVALVAVAGLAWILFGHANKPPQAATAAAVPAPAVGVRVASLKGVSQSFEFVGRIKAVEKVELRARVEGFLEKVLFREGQDVKAGQLLYQIEPVQFQALVDQAKGNLAVAEAELVRSQLEYGRQLELSKRQFSPQSQVDQRRPPRHGARQDHAIEGRLHAGRAQPHLHGHPAPIDGRIGRTAYTVGNLVNPASGVLPTIVSQDPIYVLFPGERAATRDRP
jgi:membrane fusion protein (multidrug efflux system)